jgi:N-[(2S)-2-amino-2-carboxyethyl]-L-glutamate dehydrogenase
MPNHRLLFLSRDDIARLTVDSHELCIEAIEHCLRMHAAGRFAQPLKPYLKWRGPENHIADRIIAMPAYLDGDKPIAGLKWIGSKHDSQRRRVSLPDRPLGGRVAQSATYCGGYGRGHAPPCAR